MIRCKECWMYKVSRSDFVFSNFTSGVGNKSADVMVVFDTPNLADISNDKFFSDGHYKKILSKLLLQGRIKLEDCYITSFLKCYYSANSSRKPDKNAKEKCFKLYLEKEIADVKPKIIILIGGLVSKYMIDGFATLHQAVGHSFHSNVYNCRLIPMFNLHYLANINQMSKQFRNSRKIFKELGLLLNTKPKEVNIETTSDYRVLKDLKPLVANDLETSGLNFLSDEIVTLSISDGKYNFVVDSGKQLILGEKPCKTCDCKGRISRKLCPDCKGKKTVPDNKLIQVHKSEIDYNKIIPVLNTKKLIGQNFSFDLKFYMILGYDLLDNLFLDTMIMQYLTDATGAMSLGFLVQYYFGVVYKDSVNRKNMLVNPPKDRKKYCATDSYFTLKLVYLLLEKIKKLNCVTSLKCAMIRSKMVTLLEYNGIPLDEAKTKNVVKYYRELRDKEEILFYKKAKIEGEFNISSFQQLGKLIYKDWNMPQRRFTKNKKLKTPSTDNLALQKLIPHKSCLKHIINYRLYSGHLKKAEEGKKSYLNYLQKDGKIHSDLNMFSPASLRVMYTKPNLQQIPRDSRLKELFVVPKGYSFVYWDYKAIEFRLWADRSKDPKALEFIRADRDIHTFLASRFYKIPEDKVDKLTQRQPCKNIVYGSIFGQEPKSIAMQYQVEIKFAEKIQGIFFNLCKQGYFYNKRIEKEGLEQGFSSTPFGARRYFPEAELADGYQLKRIKDQIKNYPIQSWQAEIMFLGMYKIYRAIKKLNLDSKYCMQQHDMAMTITKDAHIEIMIKIIKKYATNPIKISVPIEVEIEVGKSWADLKEV